MRALHAIRAYFALTPEHRRVIRERRVRGERTAREWRDDLAGLGRLDEISDAARAPMGCVGAAGLVAGIALCALSVDKGSWLAVPGGLLLLPALALLLGTLLLARADVPNHLRKFVLPLLRVLEQDAARGGKVTMTVDLGAPVRRDCRVSSTTTGRWFRLPKVVESRYLHRWLSIRAPLHDGSVVRWTVTAAVRQRVITKRGISGKIKTKTKHKVKHRIRVVVALPTDTYRVGEIPAAGPIRSTTRIGPRRSRVGARATVAGGTVLGEPPALDQFLLVAGKPFRDVLPVGGG